MADRTNRMGKHIGDYYLRRRLGGGGFGDVYLGEHVHTHTLVAVKVLQTHLTRSTNSRNLLTRLVPSAYAIPISFNCSILALIATMSPIW